MPRILYIAPNSDGGQGDSLRLTDAGFDVVHERTAAAATERLAAGGVDLIVAQSTLADADLSEMLWASQTCSPIPPLVRICAAGATRRYPVDTTAADLLETIAGIIGDRFPGPRTTADEPHIDLASALELAEVGTCEWDVGADHVRLTPAAGELLGCPGRSIVSLQELSALVHPDDLRHSALHLGRLVQQGGDPELELRTVMPDGRHRWLQCRCLVHGVPNSLARHVSAVILDRTMEKRNAQQRESSLRLLEAAERIGNIGSWRWDLTTNEATWSPELYRICGRDPSLGPVDLHEYTQHVHPEDRKRLAQALASSVSEGSYEAEYRLNRFDDGSERTFLARGEVQYDAHGKPSHHLGAIIDISQIRQVQRLEAIGTMAAGIAHDFNNSLTVILWAAHLLGRPVANRLPGMSPEHLAQMIVDAAKGASQKVDQLRQFYRAHEEEDEMPPVDLMEVAQEAIGLTRPRWLEQAQAAGITLQVKADLEPVTPIKGLAHELREAVTNLILNAADAMSSSGTIVIATRARSDQLLLTVSDTGDGMSEETRMRCLDAFYTTKGEHGTGLGLAMVQSTMRRHGGCLEIESQPHVGTTISLIFPNRLPTAESPVPSTTEPVSGIRILMVDDEPEVLGLFIELLQLDGHHVDGVEDGASALDRLTTATYDLVFVDRAMPVMSGDQLAAAIHERYPELPIIMLTGFGKLMNSHEQTLRGVTHILAKPIQLNDLRQAIAQVIGHS